MLSIKPLTFLLNKARFWPNFSHIKLRQDTKSLALPYKHGQQNRLYRKQETLVLHKMLYKSNINLCKLLYTVLDITSRNGGAWGLTCLCAGQEVGICLNPSDDLTEDNAIGKNINLDTDTHSNSNKLTKMNKSTRVVINCSFDLQWWEWLFNQVYKHHDSSHLLIILLSAEHFRSHPVRRAHNA